MSEFRYLIRVSIETTRYAKATSPVLSNLKKKDMREIKFRAWDIQNERMVYDPDRFEPSYSEDEKVISPWVFYETWQDREDGIRRSCQLMQFTGLLDKSGKEIYEGDRLKDSSGYIWVVYWYEDHACFGCYNESLPNIKHEIIDNLNCEVIGNVFESPDLLK